MTTHDDDDEETPSQAFSISSDAAVTVPRRVSRRTAGPKLSFGKPSKAALAALAAAVDDNDGDRNKDISRHSSALRRNRTLEPHSSTAAAAVAGLKRNATASAFFPHLGQRQPAAAKEPQVEHEPEAEDEPELSPHVKTLDDLDDDDDDDDEEVDVDGFEEDASDIAVAVAWKSSRNRITTGPTLALDSATAAVVADKKAAKMDPGVAGRVSRKERLNPKAPPTSGPKKASFLPPSEEDAREKLLLKKGRLDNFTDYTGTSRTDIESGNDDDARSTTSRITAKTNRTLKEIRDAKYPPLPEETAPTPAWCCGLSKCTWASVFLAGLAGFGVGLTVPIYNILQKQAFTVTGTLPPNKATLPPFNSGLPENNNYIHINGSLTTTTVGPPARDPQSNSVPGSNTNHVETIPVSQQDDPDATGPTPEEEPAIDVWSLFGNHSEPLPVASASYLASGPPFRQDHLEQAVELFVQGTIHRNIGKPKIVLKKKSPGESEQVDYVIPFVDTPLTAFDGEMPYPTTHTPTDKYPQGDVSRWEDLLTALGVVESDSVQWDQTNDLLYVANGKRIDVIDTKAGAIRTTIQVPHPEAEALAKDPWLFPAESDAWKPSPPQPFIEQLLLTASNDHLVVIVSDYTWIHQAKVKPLLKDSLVTRLYTYQLAHLENNTAHYELIGEPHSIHGRVLYAAQVVTNKHIHIVTSSSIDSGRLLQDPLERLYYADQHDSDYVKEVARVGQDKYIPLFVKRLLQEIEQLGDKISLLPFTKWITGEPALTEEEHNLERVVTSQDHLKELLVVTSLSIVHSNDSTSATFRQAGMKTTTSTAAFSTAFFAPANVQVIGSTDTQLTLSLPGYQWTTTPDAGRVLQEATHILQWELGTINLPVASHLAATRFQAMGTVPGRLVQGARHSTQRFASDLRLATVVRFQWKVGDSKFSKVESVQLIAEESLVRQSFVSVLDERSLLPRMGSPLELFNGEAPLLASVTFLADLAYAFTSEPAAANKARVQVVGFDSMTADTAQVPALRLLGSIHPSPQGFSPFFRDLSSGDGRKLLVSIGHNNNTDSGLTSEWVLSVWDAANPGEQAPSLLVQHLLEAPNTISTWRPQTFRVTPNGLVIMPMTVENVGTEAPVAENMNGFLVLQVNSTEIMELSRVPHSAVVMRAEECVDGRCGLEEKSLWRYPQLVDGVPSLLTVEGTTIKLMKVAKDWEEDGEAWSVSLP